ncbi:MAG: eukaryotic-like serine/threonine-protein kinase [Gemmatimonadales bacterium]|nr:eukaryotic-like serine/threonine-protein kinase [Gemmatimonadales bacterium]
MADRYRIEEEIGRGGMASVYLAEDLKHGRKVALKVLFAGGNAQGYEPQRFLREIRIAARLSHPQILPVHDSGECDGLLYFVMPYAGCESLRDRLTREGSLPIDAALRIALAVAGALGYAHRNGVIHRDIKPENILLQEGEPVVADFGVATAISAAGGDSVYITDRGFAVGTPAYMSPEQASAERDLDGRSDLYSLACVLFEMLSGQPPFAGTGPRATMARHAIEPPASIRSLRPTVPLAVDLALQRALAKDPAARFATMSDFCDALVTPLPMPMPVPGGKESRAIAVLPFVNASPDPDNEYFSDGMTDELITALTKVEGLHVASRTSVFALKNQHEDVRTIGSRLNVSAVLEGTVRKAGNRLRITVQLSSASDGRTLWSERYDREMADVFAIQDEIAQTIVRTLRTTLLGDIGNPTPVRYTENVKAYSLYLKGRFWWNRRTQADIAEGLRYFEQAIAEDPEYALAYSGLADSYALDLDYRGVPVVEGMERAKAMARKAIALDETLAEAHTSLGWVTFIFDWDWPAAEREFSRAIQLNPRYPTARQWHAWLLVAMGRFDEALAEGRAAIDLDPASVSIRRSMGWLHYYARQYEPALDNLRRALAMDPTAEETHRMLGLVYLQQGLYDDARASFKEAVASSNYDVMALAGLGHVAARRGRLDETRAILNDFYERSKTTYVSPVALCGLHVALGEADDAFGWLEQAYRERRGWLAYLKIEPILDGLRNDPRFPRLVERMRLT